MIVWGVLIIFCLFLKIDEIMYNVHISNASGATGGNHNSTTSTHTQNSIEVTLFILRILRIKNKFKGIFRDNTQLFCVFDLHMWRRLVRFMIRVEKLDGVAWWFCFGMLGIISPNLSISVDAKNSTCMRISRPLWLSSVCKWVGIIEIDLNDTSTRKCSSTQMFVWTAVPNGSDSSANRFEKCGWTI